MLATSLARVENLLTSRNYFPKSMMVFFAEKVPDTVRSMFRDLFDESKDIIEQIDTFINMADDFLDKYAEEAW